mmetsp:Transcript_12852/g.1946  ORF Transcript_12852/g.1946 Transcript_12852/m.1946 type:complete len:123 (+) Transcript_12852:239-607(+)
MLGRGVIDLGRCRAVKMFVLIVDNKVIELMSVNLETEEVSATNVGIKGIKEKTVLKVNLILRQEKRIMTRKSANLGHRGDHQEDNLEDHREDRQEDPREDNLEDHQEDHREDPREDLMKDKK